MTKVLRNLDKYLGALALFSMVTVVIAQVGLRSLFSIPLIGAIEWAQYLLISLVFFSASYAARDGEHIRMGELQKLLPKGVQYFISLLICFCGAVFFAIASYSALLGIWRNFHNMTPMGIPVPVFFLPTLLGFAFLALEYCAQFMQRVTGTEEGTEEVKSAPM